MGQGSEAEEAIRWEVIGMHAKEVTLAALIIQSRSQEEGGKYKCSFFWLISKKDQ